jgi:Kef-type K+ transport system membrane component KefB
MHNVWALASLWAGLALVATLLAIWFQISTALTEIVVGTVAQLVIGAIAGPTGLAAQNEWITFLAGTGAIVLTFLAGAELAPDIFRLKWKEATVVGLLGFFGPFLGCTSVAYYVLQWSVRSSWLAGLALSTTSVAVVYAVMLELGFNKTQFGKAILAACFINDLGTVIALGLIFSPFTLRTLVFVVVSAVVFFILPFLTPRFFKRYGGRVSELEAKYLLFLLFAMGGVAVWSGSEAVLPAYIIGMVLAGTVGKDYVLVRRLRTLTDAREHFGQQFAKVSQRARDLEVELDTAIVVGHPVEQIIHRAELDGADLIVLGRRGKSRFEKILVGSTAEKVLRYAHCPVMVVR